MAREILMKLGGDSVYDIASVKLTESALEGEDLIPGGACAAVLEAELFGQPAFHRGDEVKYFHRDKSLGIFRVEQLRQLSPNRYKLTAYDRMTLFDRDVSAYWDSILPAWSDIALSKLCSYVGVPTGSFTVPIEKLQPLGLTGITGRQLLKWLGQRWGMFFRMNETGRLLGGWLVDSAAGLDSYRLNGLTLADHSTAPIERVWVKQTEADVGAVYPDGLGETVNTLILRGNPYAPDPQTLYEKLKDFTYRPFTCAALGTPPALGRVLTLPNGEKAPVLERTLENGVWKIGAPGNPTLQSAEAWNAMTYADLAGRVLEIERTSEALRITGSDNAGKLSAMELTVDGITTRVEAVETASRTHAEASAVTSLRSELTQRADGLEFSVTQVQGQLGDKADQSAVDEITEHFRFDAEGMTITNSGTGMGIGVSEQRVIFTGGDDPTTVILPNAMETTNLHVGSSLKLGSFTFFPRANGNLSLRFTG